MLLQEIRGSQTIIWRPYYYYHHIWGRVRTRIPWLRLSHWAGCTPPTPFLSNAVKDSPGRGWGTGSAGNRTVTLLGTSICFVPLFERGNAVRFFHFVFFVSGSVSFVVFFVLLFLGSLFEKFFGSELLFYGVGVGRVVFGAVLPMFLLYYLVSRSRNRKNPLDVRSCVSGFFPLFLWLFADVAFFSFF